MKIEDLFEGKKSKEPGAYLVINLELEYVNRKDDNVYGKTVLAVACDDEEQAKKLQAKLDDISWSEDHDDLLHHMGSNGFSNFEHGYVDAIPLSSKITKVAPKLARKTFFANASDFKV